MLHAIIRSQGYGFHFIGEVNDYNLATLQQHVRDTRRGGAPVSLRLHLDCADEHAVHDGFRRWLRQLERAGVSVCLVNGNLHPPRVAARQRTGAPRGRADAAG